MLIDDIVKSCIKSTNFSNLKNHLELDYKHLMKKMYTYLLGYTNCYVKSNEHTCRYLYIILWCIILK